MDGSSARSSQEETESEDDVLQLFRRVMRPILCV